MEDLFFQHVSLIFLFNTNKKIIESMQSDYHSQISFSVFSRF